MYSALANSMNRYQGSNSFNRFSQQYHQNYQNQNHQNYQNQNFQNQNYQNQNQNPRQQNRKNRKNAIAVGPAQPEDIEPIFEYLEMKLLQKLEVSYEHSENPSLPYFTFFVNNPELKKKITNFQKIIFRGDLVFITPSEHPIDNIYINYIESIFPNCTTGEFLDLSDIKKKSLPGVILDNESFIDVSSNPDSLPFFLFLCSLKCRSLLRDISYISFDYNVLNSPFQLTYFMAFFPALRKISLYSSTFAYPREEEAGKLKFRPRKQSMSDLVKNERKKLLKSGISITFDVPMTRSDFEDPKKETFDTSSADLPFTQLPSAPLPGVVVPGFAFANDSLSPVDGSLCAVDDLLIALRNEQKLILHKKSCEVSRFVEEFFDAARNDLESVCKFYFSECSFALLADKCPPNAPMAFFAQFSTNRMVSQFQYKQPSGVKSVVQAQIVTFGRKFDAAIKAFSVAQLNDFAFAVVVHGVFRSFHDGNLYAFDRSFMIGKVKCDLNFAIFNDHIFIRKSDEL